MVQLYSISTIFSFTFSGALSPMYWKQGVRRNKRLNLRMYNQPASHRVRTHVMTHLRRHHFNQLIQKSVLSDFVMKPPPAVLHTRLQHLHAKHSTWMVQCRTNRKTACWHLQCGRSYSLLSAPEVPPILVVSGFCGRAELQLSEDCKKKLQVKECSWAEPSFSKKCISDIPLQLLVDLVTEANDVLPVLLSVWWMGGFICCRKTSIVWYTYLNWCTSVVRCNDELIIKQKINCLREIL